MPSSSLGSLQPKMAPPRTTFISIGLNRRSPVGAYSARDEAAVEPVWACLSTPVENGRRRAWGGSRSTRERQRATEAVVRTLVVVSDPASRSSCRAPRLLRRCPERSREIYDGGTDLDQPGLFESHLFLTNIGILSPRTYDLADARKLLPNIVTEATGIGIRVATRVRRLLSSQRRDRINGGRSGGTGTN